MIFSLFQGPYLDATLPSKFILDYVLGFYGLDTAQYSSCPDPHGTVKSTVVFEFPYMENFKYGGKIAIPGETGLQLKLMRRLLIKRCCLLKKTS